MKSVSMMEGDPVTLHTDAEIHTDDLIVWRFGDKGILLAKLDVGTNETSLNVLMRDSETDCSWIRLDL